MSYTISFLSDTFLTWIAQVPQIPSSSSVNNNPLIAHTTEKFIYIGILLLIISIVIVLGLISKKLKYALIFAFTLSAILIPVLWML